MPRLNVSIFRKLTLSFGSILLLTFLEHIAIYNQAQNNQEQIRHINNTLQPAFQALYKLSFLVTEARYTQPSDSTTVNIDQILKIQKIIQVSYPECKQQIKKMQGLWEEDTKEYTRNILNLSDTYFTRKEKLLKRVSDERFNKDTRATDIKRQTLIFLSEEIQDLIAQMRTVITDKQLAINQNIITSSKKTINRIILFGTSLTLLIILILAGIYFNFFYPLNKIKQNIQLLASGEFPTTKFRKRKDEIGQISSSINYLAEDLKDKVRFAKEIEQGNFSGTPSISGENDTLGNSLLSMRKGLEEAEEQNKERRKENNERAYIAQGVSDFSNWMREFDKSQLDQLFAKFVYQTINYTGTQIGGIYTSQKNENGDQYLELSAFYAFDRQKYIESRIEPGQNLVGQCFLEKDTIYITDIPKNYLSVVSGLGKEPPKSVLIVPLIHNNEIRGVLELAGIHPLPNYQIEFVEKACEILTSTLLNLERN